MAHPPSPPPPPPASSTLPPNLFPSNLIPKISTRKALLVLDLQNDFVKPDGALFVRNTPEFLDRVAALARSFRESGDVFWVQTIYDGYRPVVNPTTGTECVLVKTKSNNHNDDRSKVGGASQSLPRRDKSEDGPLVADEEDAGSMWDDEALKNNGRSRRRSGISRGGEKTMTGGSSRTPLAGTPHQARAPPRPQSQSQQPEDKDSESDDPEAFLSTSSPPCCLPKSTGAQFPAAILSAIDRSRDTVLVKSDYSPFQTATFVPSLRTRLVTELYICGSLSNVSVYATVLDAVTHGLTVTLVEDCLGFRSYAAHVDAMRAMADVLGANSITAAELQRENDLEEAQRACRDGPQATARDGRAGIEGEMGVLNVQTAPRGDDSTRGPSSPAPSGSSSRKKSKKDQAAAKTTLGPGDTIGEGDTWVAYDLDLPPNTFELLRNEVNWQKMYHMSGPVPRLVAVQGAVQPDGSIPIYRHPADESPPLLPFSPTVDMIRRVVEEKLGHPLNHVLIQLYRDGQDRISEHSDKTLDIVRGSYICNVSLGAQRTMTLRTKASAKAAAADHEGGDSGRQSQRVPLPHNSLFVLGEQTNMRWLHGIRADKRPDSEKSPEERAFNGERISLTFRQIGTFINPDTDTIWGQGAVSKTKEHARQIMHGESPETERMIRAFGQENHATEFDWDAHYGHGFDVVNFVTTATSKFVSGGDPVDDLRVRLCLVENGIRYDVVELGELPSNVREQVQTPAQTEPILLDPDGTRCVSGTSNILTHIGRHRRAPDTPDPDAPLNGTDLPSRLQAIDELLQTARRDPTAASPQLPSFDALLQGRTYLPGSVFGIDDCALWPVIRYIVQQHPAVLEGGACPNLATYYAKVGRRACVRGLLAEMSQSSSST
ncbi:hypothetical protein VTO42DRAFT_140 [Malbranchea cinnamomea]